MKWPIQTLESSEFPSLLREIPTAPTTLNYRGQLPPNDHKLLSIVGPRQYTHYGEEVLNYLVDGLAGYPICIVSGLALGIDSLAHKRALRSNLYTLAIPGGGLDDSVIYPARHKKLASDILDAGGGLLSEYDPKFKATLWSFPQRNRLVAGISHATLLVEAGEKSGTLITARLVADFNRELLVVPGNIFSRNSAGVHQFLKLGATPVTDSRDILDSLHIAAHEAVISNITKEENLVINALQEPLQQDELLRRLPLETSQASVLLMQMVLKGLIAEKGGFYHSLLN
ncbi:DNA-protecting protein DprA [bacterium]|nr:DNA-protecting protein DprA [bacterium]